MTELKRPHSGYAPLRLHVHCYNFFKVTATLWDPSKSNKFIPESKGTFVLNWKHTFIET